MQSEPPIEQIVYALMYAAPGKPYYISAWLMTDFIYMYIQDYTFHDHAVLHDKSVNSLLQLLDATYTAISAVQLRSLTVKRKSRRPLTAIPSLSIWQLKLVDILHN